MAAEAAPYGRITQKKPPVSDVHIVWMTAGLGCRRRLCLDHGGGNAAPVLKTCCSAPSPVCLRSTCTILSSPTKMATDFMKFWYAAEQGKLRSFRSGCRGIRSRTKRSSPKAIEAALGTDSKTGQPIPTTEWIDRLAPKALAVVACGTCATYGGIHAMSGNPTGCMGLADYLGWNWKSIAGLPIVNVPGCPVQPDNFMETLLYLLYQVSGLAPMIPLDDQLRPTWLFGKTVHEGCDRAGYYEQGDFATEYGSPKCILREIGMLGTRCRNCNVPKRGWMAGIGGLSQCGWNLHWLHHARISR